MPLGQCVWCSRWRLVQLQTWRSPRSKEPLCGEVCSHCYYGGAWDGCRTCKAKAARAGRASPQRGVRPLARADVMEMMERMYRPRKEE